MLESKNFQIKFQYFLTFDRNVDIVKDDIITEALYQNIRAVYKNSKDEFEVESNKAG